MKVYIIQDKETLIIFGCFSTREKAKKYINNSNKYAILETEVA